MKRIIPFLLIFAIVFSTPTLSAAGSHSDISEPGSGFWSVDRAPALASTFVDVPPDHPYHAYIEALYRAGFTVGCSTDPLMYCPDRPLNRAEGAVFFERGIHGAAHLPPQPNEQVFDDVALSLWSVKWVTALWEDGFTAGCGTDPLIFCPEQGHNRAEASVFALRILYGPDYLPPEPTGIFEDVDLGAWYADWAEAAYNAGLITACESALNLQFCPENLVTRGEMAMILTKALGLEIGEPPPPPPSVQVVSTFHSMGIYWDPAGGSESVEAKVQFRVVGSPEWRDGLPLWFDKRDGEYRGSIVDLTSGTLYEIRLTLQGSRTVETFGFRTWSEHFPIAETIYLPERSTETLIIDRAGTPEGYILYTHTPGSSATIDVEYNSSANIKVTGKAAHVIIRGLTLLGSTRHGIEFTGGAHDVVIEENDISGWGTNGPEGWGQGSQNAIYASGNAKVERIIIQRNRMHHPRSDTNSWEEYREDKNTYHPGGPQAITFYNSKGNHVIRYNEIYSDIDHYFNDPIGGGSNFSFEGFPNRDSDIYGNYVAHCWDDGIESEGANMNVRIWGNYIEESFVKIAIASTSKGPLYIWRNVAGSSRKSAIEEDSDLYGRGTFIKSGGHTRDGTWYGSGRTYVFHNTVLQPEPPVGGTYPLGSDGGIVGSGGDLYELISRNNIFINYKDWHTTFRDNVNSCTNDWDYDMYNGRIKTNCDARPHQSHGINLTDGAQPQYDPDNLLFSRAGGMGEFALLPGSPGYDDGVVLSNFNDFYTGNAPDMGAFEYGSPPMEFGVNAYR
ncbi:MAG: hypothetical protein GTO18_06595 [Anaerolineales bacterium]|nr:hypothetical protein [Anaerolineales bacterium]